MMVARLHVLAMTHRVCDKRVGAHMCVYVRVCLDLFLGDNNILQDEFGGSDKL